MTRRNRTIAALAIAALFLVACQSQEKGDKRPERIKIGLVTDVGGRGDQSFNDSALRGLEKWAANQEYTPQGYKPLSPEAREQAIPRELATKDIAPLDIIPVVLHAKQHEDYESNLQLLLDEGVQLAMGVGFMLENAVESVARKNPDKRFLLVDSPILDASGQSYELSNVKAVTFREHEGAFLVGAIAGLATKSEKIGFVGGMQLPLIRRFEVGFRAGVQATNPRAARQMLIAYTGSFNRVDAGKQVAQDMFAKGADIVFHAAGGDGLGVIAAAKEAGRLAIGCDSDQHAVAPEAVLTSLIKRVDLAVYQAVAEASRGEFKAGHSEMGLAEGGLGYAPIRNSRFSLAEREMLTKQIHILEQQIISGSVQVPATMEELNAQNALLGVIPAPDATRNAAQAKGEGQANPEGAAALASGSDEVVPEAARATAGSATPDSPQASPDAPATTGTDAANATPDAAPKSDAIAPAQSENAQDANASGAAAKASTPADAPQPPAATATSAP